MSSLSSIALIEPDLAVREAVAFALGLEGYQVRPLPDPETVGEDPSVQCLIVSHEGQSDSLALLERARARGWSGPAIVLATHPTRRLRERIGSAGARLVEKPLLDGALSEALHAALDPQGGAPADQQR